jgi:hypothetical protein
MTPLDRAMLEEADAMATLTPDACEYLRDLARKLDAARHGQTSELVREAAAFLSWSSQTVYRQLARVAGWSSGRKARSDKGSTCVSTEALVKIASAQRESIRDTLKQTMHTPASRGVMEQNGQHYGVSNGHINRLLRDRKLNVATQLRAKPVQHLRAPHPNHTHEVDPSLCLVYYLKGKQYIIRDREFYKNKLDGLAQVKFKCYRYVLYDKASATIIPWYTEARGEDQHSLFQFLMFAWGRQEGRPFHGVPRFLFWDKGSANGATAIHSLLEALDVQPLEHETGNPRAKGGVENGNNLVETQFESRLRFEPVHDVVALNRAAAAWANAYNANLIPNQDTRLKRPGLERPEARYDLWQLIAQEQLRLLPSESVCRALMTSRAEERKVQGDQTITFRHPAADRSAIYSLRGLDGINVGDKVEVRALVYGECAVQVRVPRYDGEMLVYRIEPMTEFDRFGQDLHGAVIGDEYKRARKTDAEHAATLMDQAAYPGLNADEIKAARNRKAVPFDNKLNAHGYLQEVDIPTRLPRRGSEIETPAHATASVARLSAEEVMFRVVREIGRYLSPEEHAFMAQRYADGAPEDQIKALIAQFQTPPAPEPARAAGGMRMV